MGNYYDWNEGQLTCPKCNWSGPGSATAMGESFDSGAEHHCPKCNHYFGYIAFPLIQEAATDPRASEIDRLLAERTLDQKAKVTIRTIAMRHQLKLWGLFAGALIVEVLVFWLWKWAASKYGWEADVIAFLFKGIGILGVFLIFFLGVMLWGWFRMYQGAMGSSTLYAKDPETFCQIYRDVVGPIPWK